VKCCDGRTTHLTRWVVADLLILALSLPATAACVPFTVVTKDTLNNVKAGLDAKDVGWATKLAKKYPGVCYSGDPDPKTSVAFYIVVTPDTYHGTRTIAHTDTESNPVHATVTDQNGNTSQVSGTQQTTTTSYDDVPYSVDYGIYTLYVERIGDDGKPVILQTFQQKGLYNTMYGIPLGGRGHHPEHAVIEDAMKWVNGGGLIQGSALATKIAGQTQ
jgi:hypothetical protein